MGEPSCGIVPQRVGKGKVSEGIAGRLVKPSGMKTLLLAVGLLAAARAEYPAPAAAGFHHCALIYDTAQRGPAELAPYVSRGQDWLFDSFLFLVYGLPRGVDTLSGATTAEDWRYHFERWFAPGRDLAALDQAIAVAAGRLGAPPAPRTVTFSIPFMHSAVKDFGDVNGDGQGEDLSTSAGRQAAVTWFTSEVRRRFDAANYRHLRRWGFYCMAEGIHPADEAKIKETAAIVHAGGDRYLWIPWYQAPGYQKWRELGIDVAIMQPNYAFLSVHHGRIHRNRLVQNAELARQHGLGVEIELPMAIRLPGAALLFRHYLRDGAPARLGYQAAATAYYLGSNLIEQLARPDDPLRPLYDELADYVANRTVAEPEPPTVWQAEQQPVEALGDHDLGETRAVSTVTTTWPAPRAVGQVDVFLGRSSPWTGLVLVDYQAPDDPVWRPGGWSLAGASDEPYPVLSVPVQAEASSLRLRFEGGPVAVSEVNPLPPLFGPLARHLALGRFYRFEPAAPALYADSGGELTDGRVAEGGFPGGQTVGWYGDTVAVSFDLGAPVKIDRAEVELQGGGVAAVNWPRRAVLLTALAAAPPGVA
ncbi:MAG: DUF4855 domain-containing protein, partial [Armatimonadetes bacterium]|nr:DUF4855 domain-containing protein [Armatimonadota bacterium]